ncbi:MAG: hypothetical protein E6332_04875, partial [Corynebacterium sp.]|nr:hypothetical protein [Corynebacterium sp.]
MLWQRWVPGHLKLSLDALLQGSRNYSLLVEIFQRTLNAGKIAKPILPFPFSGLSVLASSSTFCFADVDNPRWNKRP